MSDFGYFKRSVLTPDSYVESAKEMYDKGNCNADDPPSYMALYQSVLDTLTEQRSILREDDGRILSSVFCRLPLLKEVNLSFENVLHYHHWWLCSGGDIKDEYYQHHLQVVARAIHDAKNSGVAIDTIGLRGFDLPDMHSSAHDLSIVSEALRDLLQGVKVLRLQGSECVLELLSNCALGLLQLDICRLTTSNEILTDFLRVNKETLRSFHFHNMHICAWTGRLTTIAEELRNMLSLPRSAPCKINKDGRRCALCRAVV